MIPREILLGPVTIHLYGLIITMAIFLGWFLAKKRAHFYEISKAIFDDPILLVPLVLAIVGARLYHVVDFWDYYSQNWNKIFEIWNGGLGIWGALVGAVLGFYLISKIKKIDFGEIEIFVKGIGSGRESAVRSLVSHGLNIVLIKDTTPAPHNGPRPKKVRRV